MNQSILCDWTFIDYYISLRLMGRKNTSLKVCSTAKIRVTRVPKNATVPVGIPYYFISNAELRQVPKP